MVCFFFFHSPAVCITLDSEFLKDTWVSWYNSIQGLLLYITMRAFTNDKHRLVKKIHSSIILATKMFYSPCCFRKYFPQPETKGTDWIVLLVEVCMYIYAAHSAEK